MKVFLFFLPTLAFVPHETKRAIVSAHGKKPKSADDWASYRKLPRKNATKVEDKTRIKDDDVAVQIARDKKIQFEAMRDGNKVKQHDIMRKFL